MVQARDAGNDEMAWFLQALHGVFMSEARRIRGKAAITFWFWFCLLLSTVSGLAGFMDDAETIPIFFIPFESEVARGALHGI